MLTKGEVTGVYRKRAKNYNFTTQLYYLLGFRISSYREQAIKLLRLKAGDTVVDVGCGTGANFPMLQERVGQNGKWTLRMPCWPKLATALRQKGGAMLSLCKAMRRGINFRTKSME